MISYCDIACHLLESGGMQLQISVIEAFRRLLGVITPNIDNLIERFSAGNVKGREVPLLEFKASYVNPKDPDGPDSLRWNVIKAIIGMANAQGGCVILGLAEDNTKKISRGNGDPDGILSKSGKEDKDLAEHTKRALFAGDSFRDKDGNLIRVDSNLWSRLSEFTCGSEGFVVCRSHAGGDTNGFPVIAILVNPVPDDQDLISVELVEKKNNETEHSEVDYYRSYTTAETLPLIRRKWTTRTTSYKEGAVIVKRETSADDPGNAQFASDYYRFVRKRDTQRALSALLEQLGDVRTAPKQDTQPPIPQKSIFSSVRRPRAANFVGREKDLEDLHGLLADGRIPVVTGPGGTGKSELVLQYAARHKADYPGGLFQIDMEGVSDWDQVFRSMLEKPGVRDAFGLRESHDAENGRKGSAKTIPDTGPRTEADGDDVVAPADTTGDDGGKPEGGSSQNVESVRTILSDRARREGPLLLVLDNVDPKACKRLFKETVLAELDLSPGVRIVATARASDLSFAKSGPCRELRLPDLSQNAAVELLLSSHPAPSEAERKAVEKIARILGCRILYLRAVPSLLDDDDSPFAGSWRALEKGLRDNLADVLAAGMEDDRSRTPSALWRLTEKAFAANPANGNRWILLARIASFFSPNLGIRKAVLSALWKRLASPDDDSDIAFSQAANKLCKHGVLEDRGDNEFGMHRLTRAAIRRSARTDSPELEAAVGSALAETGVSERWDWISLAGSMPALTSIPDTLLDGRTCVGILLRNPLFADRCPWEKLNGFHWARLLGTQPQFVDRCPWEKLNGLHWARLLGTQPQFADRCPWEKLSAFCWVRLLGSQPQFAEHCPFDKLNGYYWARLLAEQPQFADRCPWEKLDGSDWASLLGDQPQFSDRCPWNELDSSDWASLLGDQPQFADRCPWDTLDGSDWASLLGDQPQFAVRCPWNELEGSDWGTLLGNQPQFADRCPWEKLDGSDWATLLGKQPQFANRCPWEKLDGSDWGDLLGNQPQFGDRCPWEKLDGSDWSRLLRWSSQFAEHCPWEKLDGRSWADLLELQPQFAERCPWEKLESRDWRPILISNPEFTDRLRHFAEQGNSRAQCALGDAFFMGRSMERSAEESVGWWRKSAEQGYAPAQFYLGCCLDEGTGVAQDEIESVNWFRRSAEQGYAPAQWNLGGCFAKGTGVARNEQEAVSWWRKAADQGNLERQLRLGRILLFGDGVEKNEEEAFQWFRRAAERNNEHAFAWLGYCLATGTGTPRDEQESESFFSKIGRPAYGFNEVAWGLFEAGRFSEALPFAERAVAAFRGDERFPVRGKIMILDTRAAILDALKRAEETKMVCSEILSLFPDDDDSGNREVALVRLGRACYRLEDKAGAVDAWSKALAIVEKHGGKYAEYGESADELRRLIREASGAETTASGQDG